MLTVPVNVDTDCPPDGVGKFAICGILWKLAAQKLPEQWTYHVGILIVNGEQLVEQISHLDVENVQRFEL